MEMRSQGRRDPGPTELSTPTAPARADSRNDFSLLFLRLVNLPWVTSCSVEHESSALGRRRDTPRRLRAAPAPGTWKGRGEEGARGAPAAEPGAAPPSCWGRTSSQSAQPWQECWRPCPAGPQLSLLLSRRPVPSPGSRLRDQRHRRSPLRFGGAVPGPCFCISNPSLFLCSRSPRAGGCFPESLILRVAMLTNLSGRNNSRY